MKVHNILEEEVISRVDSLYTEVLEMKTAWLTCDCEQCKLDTAAYVLNRLPAKYVVSGRGMAHTMSTPKTQLTADIDALIIGGMKKIASTSRPYHGEKKQISENAILSPVFNFPIFNGSVYDGTSFEPSKNAIITLKFNGQTIDMVDNTWMNPYILNEKTKGSYSFWVNSLSATAKDENKQFHFIIEVQSSGYENTAYAFSIPLTSSEYKKNILNAVQSIQIQDLYLFPLGEEHV